MNALFVLIAEIKLDREFDSILNNDKLCTFIYPNEVVLYSDNYNLYPGLTIKNYKKGPGVIISKIIPSGLFKYYNFEVGEILLFINDVPCCNHKDVMDQIMYLYISDKRMKISKL